MPQPGTRDHCSRFASGGGCLATRTSTSCTDDNQPTMHRCQDTRGEIIFLPVPLILEILACETTRSPGRWYRVAGYRNRSNPNLNMVGVREARLKKCSRVILDRGHEFLYLFSHLRISYSDQVQVRFPIRAAWL